MEERATKFFDTAYTHFVLRDVLGKALPGSFLVCGCSVALEGQVMARSYAESMNAWGYAALAGIGWVIATGLQLAVTETLTKVLSGKGLIKQTALQPVHWDASQKLADERLTVLKEATGNMASSMIIVAIVYASLRFGLPKNWAEVMLYSTFVVFLTTASFAQRQKQMGRRLVEPTEAVTVGHRIAENTSAASKPDMP